MGAGFVQVRVLFCTPRLQRALQSDHPDQEDHPPFTGNQSRIGRELVSRFAREATVLEDTLSGVDRRVNHGNAKYRRHFNGNRANLVKLVEKQRLPSVLYPTRRRFLHCLQRTAPSTPVSALRLIIPRYAIIVSNYAESRNGIFMRDGSHGIRKRSHRKPSARPVH